MGIETEKSQIVRHLKVYEENPFWLYQTAAGILSILHRIVSPTTTMLSLASEDALASAFAKYQDLLNRCHSNRVARAQSFWRDQVV